MKNLGKIMMSFGQYHAEHIWRYGEHLRTDGGNIWANAGTYGKVMFPHEFTIKHAVSPVDVDFITKKNNCCIVMFQPDPLVNFNKYQLVCSNVREIMETRSILDGYFNPLVFWYQWEYLLSK